MTADGNNHLSGFSYDASGNTTNDGVNSYTWDAESQLSASAGVTYAYDAQGRRVSKSTGKNYICGLGGDILAETDGSGNTTADYVFFGGKRVAMVPTVSTPIYYVCTDLRKVGFKYSVQDPRWDSRQIELLETYELTAVNKHYLSLEFLFSSNATLLVEFGQLTFKRQRVSQT